MTCVSVAQSVQFGQSKVQDISSVYKRVKIDKKTPNLFDKLNDAGVDVACGVYFAENHIEIELSEYELNRISENGISYVVLIEDMTKFYSERATKDMPIAQMELQKEKLAGMANRSSSVKSTVIKNIGQHDDCSELTWNTPTNFTLPSTFGGCLTYSGMVAELDKMRSLYPNLISVKANASPTNQLTHEGRIVYVVKISDNPDTNELEPQALTTGMTHSREVSSLMNQIFYMWYLLENYNSDPFIKNLVDNTELYFIPVVNPDGLVWNQTIAPNGGGMQRKNLRAGICNPGGTAATNNTRGVDINRNFGYQYGLVGSSATQCDNTYRGTGAFSEPETQIMRDFIVSKNIKTALNHHAYSNLLPHPVNGRASTPTGRENEYAKFCHDMTQYNRYVYGPAPSVLYAASGDASDWMAGGPADATGNTGSGKNVLAVSPENGAPAGEGDFWPSPTLITTIAKRAMRMNFINSYYSGKYAKLHDLTQSNITSLNSNLTFGIERLGQTPSGYTLTVTPVSSNITSITSPAVQTGMTILEQRNVTAALVLSPSILPNQKIEYKVTLSNDNYVLYEANYVKIYNPTVLFNNLDSDVLTKWTQTGTWVTTTSPFTGTTSISDSAAGTAYANSTSKALTTTANINLSGAQKVLVQYYAKWDLERNFDLVQIQGSVNGTTWTTLCGNYTKPTSTSSTNPHATKSANSNAQSTNGGGGVLYDGDTRGKWAMEEIVIDANNNSFLVGATAAKFRFRLISDNSNAADMYNTTFDGFYFDDFKVIKQISEPPVAICKNATLALGAGGTLTVLPADVNNNSTDDIGITNFSVSPNTFNCTQRNTTQNVTLTVTDADGQTSSCVATVTITDPNPVAGTVSVNQSICTGSQPANITLTGSAGTIQWQSSTDNTTFTNLSGQTTATLAGSAIGNLTATRYYRAVITNGNCGTTVNSNVVTVTVRPNSTITSTNPTSRLTNSGAFTLTVNGTNFVSGESIVRWNGTNRTTTFVSATQLTANINAADVSTAGTANITVFNTCNSSVSNTLTFTISSNCTAPVPNVASLPTVNAQCSATVTAPTATSNCYGTITATTVNPTTYNAQGSYVINWTYNDGNGNTSMQQQTVVISDTTAPVANVTNLPALTGQCSVTVSQTPTATDNCMGTINATTTDPLSYSVQGTYSILWTYTDNRGNQSFQQQSVVVSDTTAPVRNVTTLPTVTGQCSATVTAPTATDNCAGQITGTTTAPLTYNTQGTFNITWTYNDGNGNTSTQTQTVIVDDTTAPVANVTNLPTRTGQCSATVTAPTATDNCVGQITATTTSPLTYNTQGTFNITWTYNDGNGNTSTQTQTVIVDDTIAPVANVASLPTASGQCSATVTAPTATDNCAGQITATTTSPLTYNTQGTFNITWTYNDGNGNTSTQTQTVIVDDTVAPVANVTNLPTVTGQCSATVTAPTATDTCAGTITGTTTSPLTYNAQGTYNITWTYNDGNGNTSTQTQTVVVDDTIAPVANVASLPTVTGQCSATVTAPTANDNCAGTITGTTNSPLTYNTQGTFNITWTYNDGNGNTSTQNQTVIINNTNPPTPTVATLPTVTGQCNATVTNVPTASICSGTVNGTTNNPLTYTSQGTYTIVWTYNDGNGNTSTQNQTVIVDDTIAPVANVASLATVTGQCSATVTAPTATDNCVGQITGTTTSPLTYNAQGTYNITWTYNDGNGNTSTQNQTVIVDDTIAPVANVASLSTVTGQCSATVTAPTATDNCAGQITATTTSPLTYTTQGTFNITWTYNDGNGNTSTQTQTVIVDDIVAPVANVTSLPTVTGQCTASVTAPTATDDCAGTITGTTTSPLTYNAQGTYEITWTYNDGNGNTSTQIQTVIVDDTIAPVANVISLPTVTGECSASVTAPTATDNCAGTITATTTDVLTYNTQGTFNITWTYNDGNGNTSTQTQTVIVDDTVAPVANVTPLPTVTGQCSATVTAPTATDACAGTIVATTSDPLTYTNQGTYNITWTYDDGNGNTSTQMQTVTVVNGGNVITFYQDLDGDSFGNASVFIQDCAQPIGYVTDSSDCNDNQIQYADNDNDGFGSTTQVACGVTNNTDCNDNNPTQNVLITYYQDLDGDAFGNPNVSIQDCSQPIGYVLDASDCDDTQLQYNDADGDGFGSTTIVACGVPNNIDCNDTNENQNVLITFYQDLDGDTFGNPSVSVQDCSQPVGYVIDNTDCNDTQIQYADNDGDGFGSMTQVACGVTNNTDCNDDNPTQNVLITFYQDLDNDTFGNPAVSTQACTQPVGYVLDASDCNDNQIQYADLDADGFGSTTQVACGVTNNTDCNDNQLTYADNDADGFGSTTLAACGVTNNTDCNDNQLTYADNDADGFGSTTLAACGVTNNTDCNDNQLTYADNDADGFGSTTLAACGVINNTDCNDNQLTYADNDADGFGSTTLAACGVTNNTDCNDNQLTYADNDADGFGSTTLAACGVTNNTDCNDNQLTYADNDADGFGSTTLAACGVTNNTDCDDNNPSQNVLLTFYQDLDNDTFGNPAVSTQACSQPVGYVTNNLDCNDTQIQYADVDGDGFGSTTQVACGVTNNTDCNDNNPSQNALVTFYQDLDGDTFGNPAVSTQACSQPLGYVTNNLDCNDNNAASNALNTYYQDSDNDGFGNPNVSLQACAQPVGYVLFGTDCDDTRANVNPNATDVCYDGLDNDCNGIIDNSCTPIVTTLAPATCGVTLAGWYSTITAIWSNNAQGYRFRITKVDANTNAPIAQSIVVDRPVNNISLANIAGTTYNSRYQIEVAVKFNNVWQPFFGAPCFVDTPNPTSAISTQCGATLTAFNQWVTADAVAVVSQYRFRITEMNANGTVPTGTPAQVITSNSNKFNMTQLTGVFHNTFYRVEVALRNTDGTFLPYGSACNVKTPAYPTTQLLSNYCNGYNVTSNTEFIAASPVSNATLYRFRLFNASGYDTMFTTTANKFNLNNFPGITSGTYSVQVSVKLPNELNFGPYGSTCSIIKQGTSSRIVTEESLDEVAFEVAVYPNPFTNNFNIKTNAIFNKNTSITVYDLTGRQIEKINLEANELENVAIGASYPSGVYSMIVTQGNNTKMIRIIKR